MRIIYKNADNRLLEFDVNDKVGLELINLDKQDAKERRYERRRKTKSLDEIIEND